MDYTIKPHINYFFVIVALLAVWTFASCSNEIGKVEAQNPATEIDSTKIWIAAGRDASNGKEIRKQFLAKAYESAKSKKNDSLRLKYLSKIQWSFLGLNDSLLFRKTNEEANQLAQRLGDSMRLAGSYWDLGLFLNRIAIKDSAYYHLSKAEKIYSQLGEKKRVGLLFYDIASIQEDIKDYTGSEINLIRAIELLKPLNENFWLYNCYDLLGVVAKDLNDYDRALTYYNIAADYLKKSGMANRFENSLENNIGVNYLEMGAYEKASSYFENALKADSLRIKTPENYARTLNNLAQSLYKGDPSKNVEAMFLESLKIRDSAQDLSGLAGGYYSLAEYYTYKRDTSKAIASAKKAIDYSEQSSNNERLLESLELLTRVDPKNASMYGQNYIALTDSLAQEERKLRDKFARIRFETDEVVAENQLLARQKQLWAGIAISVLLLGTAAYAIIDQRAKNQKLKFQQEQQISDEKIFNLMLSEKQQFEEGKKIEQKRISEELHDGVLGKILGARMVLTGLNKKTDEESISERSEAIAALKHVEGEVRSISHELSHAAYQEIHNFIRSINDLLKNSAGAANINHTFNFDDTIDWDSLRGDIKINLYRIVQENVQNAIKHAQCDHIKLDFSVVDDDLKVTITDDGVGFIMDRKKRKGIGMRNLQSRITKLNGNWKVDSKPGKGTLVELSIPIAYLSKNPQIFDEPNEVEKV